MPKEGGKRTDLTSSSDSIMLQGEIIKNTELAKGKRTDLVNRHDEVSKPTQPNINQIIKKFDTEQIHNFFNKGKKIGEIDEI